MHGGSNSHLELEETYILHESEGSNCKEDKPEKGKAVQENADERSLPGKRIGRASESEGTDLDAE